MSLNLSILAGLLSILVITATIYHRWRIQYWQKRNIPLAGKPLPILGNAKLSDLMVHPGYCLKRLYDDGKLQKLQHAGIFILCAPVYIPIDPTYIKNVLQSDFEFFPQRGIYYARKDDPLSTNLTTVTGNKWRNTRSKLSKAFTPSKIKKTFSTCIQSGLQMLEAVDKIDKSKGIINVHDISTRYTVDIIGSCGFGLDCNSFKNSHSDFIKYGKRALDVQSPLRYVKFMFKHLIPEVAKWLDLKMYDNETTEFFINIVKETATSRRANKFPHHDIFQFLMELESEMKLNNEQSNEDLAGHSFMFFLAGFETSSSTITFCLYELARNKDIQDMLRAEIKQHKEITYDSIAQMKYMGQVVDETLRKYPPASVLPRVCEKDYQIPNTKSVLEKGTVALISVLGLHYDPNYYPEPEKFNPMRFTEENASERPPFTFIPFGEGPRICLAYRFGLMVVKVGLSFLLKNYEFALDEDTADLELDPRKLTLVPKNKILLKVQKVH